MRSFLTEGTAEVPGAHRANAAGFAPRPLSRSYRNGSSGYAFHDTELTFRLSSPTFTGMSQLAAAAAADDRPLRADARRNREKVLAAARAVFSEAGRDAQIDDV